LIISAVMERDGTVVAVLRYTLIRKQCRGIACMAIIDRLPSSGGGATVLLERIGKTAKTPRLGNALRG